MTTTLKPLADRVLVEPIEEEEITSGCMMADVERIQIVIDRDIVTRVILAEGVAKIEPRVVGCRQPIEKRLIEQRFVCKRLTHTATAEGQQYQQFLPRLLTERRRFLDHTARRKKGGLCLRLIHNGV